MKKILLKWVLPFAITAGALWLAFSWIENPRAIPGHIASVPWHIHVAFIALTMVSMWFRAVRWKALLPGHTLTSHQCFGPLMIGFMMNSVLPGRAGEFARSIVLGRKAKIPFTEVFGSVLLERIFDGVILLASFVVVMALLSTTLPESVVFGERTLTGEELQGAIRGLIAIVAVLLAGVIAVLIPATRRLFERIAKAILPEKIGEFAVTQLENLVSGFRALHSPARVVAIVFWTLVVWAFVAWSLQVAALGFPQLAAMSYLQAWAIVVVICIAILIPAAPGYWGLYEVGVLVACLMLSLVDAETQSVAIAFSVVIHLWQFVSCIAVGLLYVWIEQVKIGEPVETDSDTAPETP